jgi:hypothetical protein
MSGHERVDRRSPEPSTVLARVLGFSLSKEHRLLTRWQRLPAQFFNSISRTRIDPSPNSKRHLPTPRSTEPGKQTPAHACNDTNVPLESGHPMSASSHHT